MTARETADRLMDAHAPMPIASTNHGQTMQRRAAFRDAIEAALADAYRRGEESRSPDDGWRSRETAPKDGTPIWAVFRSDIYPILRPGRPDLECWNGVQACIRHPGIAADGFDIGWNMAAPVGHGGFATEWIAGWRPLPSPPTDHTPEEET